MNPINISRSIVKKSALRRENYPEFKKNSKLGHLGTPVTKTNKEVTQNNLFAQLQDI